MLYNFLQMIVVGAIYKSVIPENRVEHAVHTCEQTDFFLLEKNSFEPWLPKHTDNSFPECVTSIKSRFTEMFLHILNTHSMDKWIYSNIAEFIFLWSIIQTLLSQEPLLHHREMSHKIPLQPIRERKGKGLSTPYCCADEKKPKYKQRELEKKKKINTYYLKI